MLLFRNDEELDIPLPLCRKLPRLRGFSGIEIVRYLKVPRTYSAPTQLVPFQGQKYAKEDLFLSELSRLRIGGLQMLLFQNKIVPELTYFPVLRHRNILLNFYQSMSLNTELSMNLPSRYIFFEF